MKSGLSSTPQQAGHGAPFLSFSTVFNQYFVPAVLPDLMDTSEKEQAACSVKAGDIFLTRTSETTDELAMSCVALEDSPKATFSGFVKRLRPTQTDVTDPKFMGFYLRSPLFRKTMTNNAVMVLRASLNEQIFSYLDLLLPEQEEQVRIGELLHKLTTKIELNNRINAELEALAKTIYDYWFVQFDFPDKRGKPYKTSGGKMLYNERLKREIPAGWSVTALREYIRETKTGDWGATEFSESTPTQVRCFRGADLNALNGSGQLKAPRRYIGAKKLDKQLSAYDLVIEISGGSPTQSTGRMALLTPQTLLRFQSPIVCSNFCRAISLVDAQRAFEFQQLWQSLYKAGAFFGWEGKTSGIKNLQLDAFLDSYSVPLPPFELSTKYFDFCESLSTKKQLALEENQHLTQLRDWLLPMLMNGQVTVK